MITIDGAAGEGGGQIVRTAVGLALVTGQPCQLVNIRAGRRKPGLLAQHLTAVQAAAQISGAELQGAQLGAHEFTLTPGQVAAGKYHFQVGTAGSATLVLQTILPALMIATGISEITLEGGTHNPFAPPFDFLQQAFFPLLQRMGVTISATIARYGFYPAGGGQFTVTIQPAQRLAPLELLAKGALVNQQATALVAKIPPKIAEDEINLILKTLDWNSTAGQAQIVASPGPGNAALIAVAHEQISEVFTAFGERGKSRQQVAQEVIAQYQAYARTSAPVGAHLADQLLIPLALAGQGRFRTTRPTLHTTTNIAVIQQFLPVAVTCAPVDDDVWEIQIER